MRKRACPLAVISMQIIMEAGCLVHCYSPPKQKFDPIAYNMNSIRKSKPQGAIEIGEIEIIWVNPKSTLTLSSH